MEIVVNGTTGLLHPAAKEGVTPLANNIVKLATHVERRLTWGKKGYERVKERFLEPHMSHRIAGFEGCSPEGKEPCHLNRMRNFLPHFSLEELGCHRSHPHIMMNLIHMKVHCTLCRSSIDKAN